MFQKRVKKIYTYVVVGISFVFIITSCSKYERALRSHDYKLKYKKAFEYYNKEDYVRAAALFDQLAPAYKGTAFADSVHFFQAKSYYYQRDYLMASHMFQVFSRTYGASPFVEEADFMVPYCYYMMSPRPNLDQSNTVTSLENFQLYLIRHPESEKVEEVTEIMNELKDKLVEKSFLSARLYFDLGDYKASLVALGNSLVDYPDSKYREDILFMVLKSSYLLAFNSIEAKKKERYQATVDEYYSFIAEYPESKLKREADRYYRQSSKYLESGTEINETDDGL